MENVIIVGGGIAGLAAGIYARLCGYEATIFEMHDIPGGNSTSWRRGGYLFEGGMHWLTGSSKDTPLYPLWKQVGALEDDTRVLNRDPFLVWRGAEESVCLYRDPQRLKRHLTEISPQDAKAIASLCADISRFCGFTMPVANVKGVEMQEKTPAPTGMLLKMPSVLPRIAKLNKMSAEEYAEQFQHPGIRALLRGAVGADFNATALLFTLATMASGDGGYPVGGSLAMARRMADRFESLGGEVRYRCRVEKVLVEGGKAVGVASADGEHRADAVIVTSDTLTAIDRLFDMPLNERWMDRMRKNTRPVLNSFISLGIEADLSDLPEGMMFPLSRPMTFMGSTLNELAIFNYASFDGYAPKGCTAVTSMWMGDTYDEWRAAKEGGTYTQKKGELAALIVDRLAQALPQTAGKVAVWDVATPLTYERYCGTYRGSWMTVMGKNEKGDGYPNQAESIGRLYFAGQRIQPPGGLPTALSTGRRAVQTLCAEDHRLFRGK